MCKYITLQGDTWDVIAYKVYKNERLMHLLIEANLDFISTAIFPANIELNIPEVSKKDLVVFPPWRAS